MSGKFINKTYVNTIESMTTSTVNKVKTANYVFNNLPPVISNWYNLNNKATTLDEGTRSEYSSIGKRSTMKYNKITDAIFYSSNIKIELDVDYNDEGLGLSSQPGINGIVLPNTWIPYQGDYFTLKHAGREYMYKVNTVSFDTIDNGNNVYRFEASIANVGIESIEELVVERFKMIINNVGTNFNAVIQEESYNAIDKLDQILIRLKDYYIALFYNERVQTFTYDGYYGKLYDPYLIEFLLRNNILNGSTEYIFVHHEIPVPRTFSIEYDRTYFRALENKDKNLFNNGYYVADVIDNNYSLFSTVKEEYYMIDYNKDGIQKFTSLNTELIDRIVNCNEYIEEREKLYLNIIIKYMNDKIIHADTLITAIENVHFDKSNTELFYALPMIIFIIEKIVKKLMT